jgi:hypothetical protein
MELLRKGIRAECRKRGWALQTTVQDRRRAPGCHPRAQPAHFAAAEADRYSNPAGGTGLKWLRGRMPALLGLGPRYG